MSRRALCLALVLVAASLAAAAGPAVGTDSPPTYRIDADHGLDTEEAIQAYEENGSVSASIDSPKLTMTVASEAAACGVEASAVSDTRNDYLCIDYKQDTAATLRLHVPRAYWHPYVKDSQQSIADDVTATVQPTQDGNYTSFRFSVDGPTKAVFAVPEDVALTYDLIERANAKSDRVFGVEFWSRATSWRYVNGTTFGDDAAISLETKPGETQLQYDADPGPGTTWLTIPNEQSASAPVYWFQREGEPNTIYIVSEVGANETPQIRYRATGGGIAQLDAALDQIARVDDWLQEVLNDVLPESLGGESEDSDTDSGPQARVTA